MSSFMDKIYIKIENGKLRCFYKSKRLKSCPEDNILKSTIKKCFCIKGQFKRSFLRNFLVSEDKIDVKKVSNCTS